MNAPVLGDLGHGLLLDIVGDEHFPLDGRQLLHDDPVHPLFLDLLGQADALVYTGFYGCIR